MTIWSVSCLSILCLWDIHVQLTVLCGILGKKVRVRQIFEAHNFHGSCNLKCFADQGNPVSHAFFAAPNFRGSRPIREKRENYATRKFGAIRYIYTSLSQAASRVLRRLDQQ